MMLFTLFVLVPVVASTNGDDYGLRTGRKQTLAISSGGKLEASADMFAHEPNSVVRRVSPRNELATEARDVDAQAAYNLNPGASCTNGYVPLTSRVLCKSAAESLGFAGDSVAYVDYVYPWGASRPQGCFQSDGNSRFHFNTGTGGSFVGADKILCQLASPTGSPTHLPTNAPTKGPTALLSESSQCVTWHNFSHYVALAFGNDTTAAGNWFAKETKAFAGSNNSKTGPYATIWFNTATKTITDQYGSPSDTTFVNLCTACGLGGPDPAAVRTFCYAMLDSISSISSSGGGGRSSLSLSDKGHTALAPARNEGISFEVAKNTATKDAGVFVKATTTASPMEIQKANAMPSTVTRDVQRETLVAAAPKEAVVWAAPKADVQAAPKSDDNAPAVKRESSTQGSTPTCSDHHGACGAWSQMGECDKNPGYMYIKCRASCNKCR